MKPFLSTLLSTLILGSLLIGAQAFAQVPATMSYQGVLTDAGGNLVADGFYDLTFRLYDAPTAGNLFYTEAHTGATNHVQVSRGGFSVLLGSITTLSLGFDGPLYLSVQVASDPEMSPRIPLASSPYALGLRIPFQLSSTAGSPLLEGYAFAGLGAAFDFLGPSGYTMVLEPDVNGSGGYFSVNRNGSSSGFIVDGNTSGSGEPTVSILGSLRSAIFDMTQSGDASVRLPPSSISANEILDEPGIAQNHVNGGVSLPFATIVDVVSVTISLPAPGYVVVTADAEVEIPTQGDQVQIQITDTPGVIDGNHFFWVGGGVAATTLFPSSIHRTYFLPAGPHTFYFEAQSAFYPTAPPGATNATITAEYFPTSYGSVVTAPSGTAAAARSGSNGALVDLRELELRAAKATAEAERAERELIDARARDQQRAIHSVNAATTKGAGR